MTEKNIHLEKLKKGNRVLLETKECVFDLEILSPENGVVLITGGRRFTKPTIVTIVGAFGRRKIEDEDKLLAERQIERNIGIELQYNNKNEITCDFVTSPIVSGKIYGDNWSFEMWERIEQNKKMEISLEEARARIRLKTEPKENNDENTLS